MTLAVCSVPWLTAERIETSELEGALFHLYPCQLVPRGVATASVPIVPAVTRVAWVHGHALISAPMRSFPARVDRKMRQT